MRRLAALLATSAAAWSVAAMPAASSLSSVPRRTVVIGHSVDGRRLVARVIGPDSARRKVLLVGCIHGDECAGLRILSAVAARRPPADVQLWLVGELNPDGTAAGTRQKPTAST